MNDRALQIWADSLRGRQRWTEQQAREVLQVQSASGESPTTFCRRMGLAPQRLVWWRQRLANSTGLEQHPGGCQSAQQFVPVVVRPTQQGSDESALLRVRIGDHVVVEVRHADANTAAWVALFAAGYANGAEQ